MNTKKRMFPFEDLPHLINDNGLHKRQCLHKTIEFPDVLHDSYNDNSTMEWHTSGTRVSNPKDEGPAQPVNQVAVEISKVSVQMSSVARHVVGGDSTLTASVCPRCQAGEPGHIGHINR